MYNSLEYFDAEFPADGVLILRMNRNPVNALSVPFKREFIRVFDYVSEDSRVKVVILTGNGQLFSAGADLKERQTISPAEGEYRAQNRITREVFHAIEECEKPIVAAVDGAAIGAGVGLACSADILVCSEDAYFLMPEVKVGLAGGASRLAQLFPPSVAKYAYYAAQPIGASTLEKYGVVLEVVEKRCLIQRAREIAERIATMDADLVATAKHTFGLTAGMDPRKAYRYEQGVTLGLAKEERSPILE